MIDNKLMKLYHLKNMDIESKLNNIINVIKNKQIDTTNEELEILKNNNIYSTVNKILKIGLLPPRT